MSDEDSEIIHYVSDDWKSQGSPMPTAGGWSKGVRRRCIDCENLTTSGHSSTWWR